MFRWIGCCFLVLGMSALAREDTARARADRKAPDDPTFLMAPVRPVLSYEAINLNANKFENIVHRFFAESRLDIEIKDRFGKPIRPREWFLLPLSIIERAVPMIIDGSILRYRYDHRACKVIARLN